MDTERQFGYLTVREVARRAGVSESWVQKVCANGDLVAFKHGGSWWIFPGSAEVWIDSDRRPGRPFKGRGKMKGRQLLLDVDNED